MDVLRPSLRRRDWRREAGAGEIYDTGRNQSTTRAVTVVMRKTIDESQLPGGDLELALLAALCARGTATIRELHDEVGTQRSIVYTTVAKVVERLVSKGLVKRKRAGRTFTYQAVARQQPTQRA